jgi:uncharacterized membrane protein YfcA
MSIPQAILLFFAAMIAGALNSVAGGGSFISFPALLFTGIPPKLANATNTIALWPGSVASVNAYREEIKKPFALRFWLMGISVIGGLLGAILLLVTPEATFGLLLPWLLLFALLLFIYGKKLSGALRDTVTKLKVPTWATTLLILAAQLFVAVYGGFFGGGIGIMMLAVLSLAGMDNIHTMNGIKTLLATCINGIAVLAFVVTQQVVWGPGVVMIIGAVLGGYFGAYYAQKISPVRLRQFVIVVGIVMTAYFFYRTYFQGS